MRVLSQEIVESFRAFMRAGGEMPEEAHGTSSRGRFSSMSPAHMDWNLQRLLSASAGRPKAPGLPIPSFHHDKRQTMV
jgi:hypothetical protein